MHYTPANAKLMGYAQCPHDCSISHLTSSFVEADNTCSRLEVSVNGKKVDYSEFVDQDQPKRR